MHANATVLIVDDISSNIDVLSKALKHEYKVKAALRGKDALKICLSDSPPDIVLLDVMMPEMDGYEVCETLKSNVLTTNIPIIFVTALGEVSDEQKGLDMGAVDYITKPISPAVVRTRVKNHLALYDQRRHLESMVQVRTEELEQSRLEIILRLGRAAEYKDNETGMHVKRMSHYSKLLARAVGLDEAYCDLILKASPMHDIGKIGIPDNILLKPGKLDKGEWEVMRTHPEIGAQIIGEHTNPLLRLAREIALTHHEKWDGSGYPRGLKSDEIPLPARIVAVADVFDALTTERPYKKAWTVDAALELLDKESGKHFDPIMVNAFTGILEEVLRIKSQYAEVLETD